MRHGGWKNAKKIWWPNEFSDRHRYEPLRGMETAARAGRLDSCPLVHYWRSRADDATIMAWASENKHGFHARSGFRHDIGINACE